MEICRGESRLALLLGQRGVYRREECNIEARSRNHFNSYGLVYETKVEVGP